MSWDIFSASKVRFFIFLALGKERKDVGVGFSVVGYEVEGKIACILRGNLLSYFYFD